MQINRRVTNGLAWAGVALVVGIPAADALTGRFAAPEAGQVTLVSAPPAAVAPTPAARPQPAATVEPVAANRPAAAPAAAEEPAPIETAAAGNVVDRFIQSGRPLPSYITDGSTPAAEATSTVEAQPTAEAAPAAVAPPAAAAAAPSITLPPGTGQAAQPAPAIETALASPESVSSTPSSRVAPLPMPLSMRPQPQPVAAPSVPAQATVQPGLVSNPAIVIPDSVVTGGLAPASGGRIPPAPVPDAGGFVGPDELADWESGPLSEFLARRQGGSQIGVQSGNGWGGGQWGSSATYETEPEFYVYPVY